MTFPWRTLLVASLSINLLIVGAGIGFVAGGARLGAPVDQRQLGRQPFLRALVPEDRTMLMRELENARSAGEADRRAAGEARRALIAAAQKDPYDEAEVRKALSELREADGAVLAGYHDALATALGKLPANGRAQALRAIGRPGQLGQGGRPGQMREKLRERIGPPPQ